jgi:polysaccharide pyruvyl transferase WcaK-like protein
MAATGTRPAGAPPRAASFRPDAAHPDTAPGATSPGRQRPAIAIFGPFGTPNFGNEATLRAILFRLRRFHPGARITCVCTEPEVAAAIHHVEAIPVVDTVVRSWLPRNSGGRVVRKAWIAISEPYRWVKCLLLLRRIDMLIVPGTGVLTDGSGLLGWGPYNLFRWSVLAKAGRCRLLFVSVGAGPIDGALGRYLVKAALSRADFRSYRDVSTKQYLRSIGFPAEADPVYPDLVFGLPEPVTPPEQAGENRRPVVGIGLMEFPGRLHERRLDSEAYRAYLDNLVRFTRWLLAHGFDIRLLIGDRRDGRAAYEYKQLVRKRLDVPAEARIIDDPILSIEDLTSQIQATDMVVATRFHNVLFALLCDKPVVSVAFHHKCESLMSAMAMSEYSLDIRELTTGSLIETFCELEASADDLKPLIRERTRSFRDALDRQYQEIFAQVGEGSRDGRVHTTAEPASAHALGVRERRLLLRAWRPGQPRRARAGS